MRWNMAASSAVLSAVLSFAFVAVAQEAAQPAAPADPDGPKLVVEPQVFDFGEVWEGAPAEGIFTLKNAGKAPLTINSRSSCGCTVATKPKSPLAPGEETTFKISYSTKRLGKANKHVYLETNDKANPRFDIPVRGMVKGLFEITPTQQIIFQDIEVGEVASDTIKLVCQFDEPVNLKLNEKQNFGRFDVELKEVKPGAEYELKATTKPPLQTGRNYASVLLDTGLPLVPSITIRLRADVPAIAALKPSTLLVTPSMDKPIKRVLRFEYRKDEPIEITKVTMGNEDVEWQVLDNQRRQAPQTGKTAWDQLQITLPPYGEIPDRNPRVQVYTSSEKPEYSKLEVPVIKRDNRAQRRPAADKRRQPGPAMRGADLGVVPTGGRQPAQPAPAKPAGTAGAGQPKKPAEPASNPDAEALKKQIEEAIRKAQARKAAEEAEKAKQAEQGAESKEG